VRTHNFFAILSSVLLLVGGTAKAQTTANTGGPSGGIYSCTDSRGRIITADRPIADCIDREQRELNPSGTTRRTVEPTYTARESAEREERARQQSLLQARQLEERRRERALLVRYPNAAAHNRERAEALVQIDAVTQAAKKRLAELSDERKKIDEELEFYKSDIGRAPGAVRRKLDDNVQSMAVQNRFVSDQEDEKKRVNSRFDDERIKLRQLWTSDAGGTAK
jgi:hypothetical protein